MASWQLPGSAIEDAGKVLPTTWNWFDTLGVMVAGSWLFAYSYCITFIAGEVKRPDKTIILANLSAILVPAFFMIWLAIVLYRTVGFEFLSATAWVDNMGERHWQDIHCPGRLILSGWQRSSTKIRIVVFMMALSFILFNLVVGGAFLPGIPAHPVCLGHGPHGSQVVCRY